MTRSEIQKKYPRLYSYLLKYDMDLFDKYIPTSRKTMTQKEAVLLCKEVKSIKELRRKHPSKYDYIYRHFVKESNWRKIAPHFREPPKWTEDKLRKIALEYSDRTEFYKAEKSAYSRACFLGILDEITKHMGYKYKKKSDEEIIKIAKLYEYLNDFRADHKLLYTSACRRNINLNFLKRRKKGKAVINLTKSMYFKSITEAANHFNIDNSCIIAACKGRQKTAGGYRWEYA